MGEDAMTDDSGWTIVLIDDEEGIRKVTGITLRDAGYTVHTAPDGESGLELCETVGPQIVITDVRMPGMDGIAVLEAVKERHPDIEVIVATAFGEMDLAIRALQLNASDFITKPINDDALSLALARARERYTARRQLREYTRLLEEGWNETTTELMETFAFQQNLIESSMDGILGINGEGEVVIVNRSLEIILGVSRGEVLRRKTLADLFTADGADRIRRDLTSERYGGVNHLFLYETSMTPPSGGTIPVQLSASTVFNQNGTADGLVCYIRDLREIRRLEREVEDQAKILQQDKMMSLGRLAASVVHEINNPLAGVLNYCRLMLRILGRGGELSAESREKFERYLKLVESETGRCSKIVSNLLIFSRKSPAELGPVNVADLMGRSILLSQHKLELSNITLESAIDDHLPSVTGDFNQLQQCIINLIFNAIDAMPEGGTLFLSADRAPDGGGVVIRVRDTGVGIPDEHLDQIFEPFFTTKDEGYGVGLGLSTVYGIIRHHNGTIDVRSTVGEGSTFEIRLPAA
jgi:two-component system, NtrC family, sensor kinase